MAIFFGLEKAYEIIWKYGVMRDLHALVPRRKLTLFLKKNFLFHRNFRIRVGSTLSNLLIQEAGIPQESIPSITLFLKFDNIVKCLKPTIDCTLYVDDFVIYYRSTHIHIVEW